MHAPPAALWRVIEGVGGENGWYSFPLAWSVRGWLDRLVGGVGLRRGRRDPHRLQVGEALDFWRVEEIEPGELLRLRAEMRLPGRAWLEMRAEPTGDGRSRYAQRAVFLPRGLAGHAYWGVGRPVPRAGLRRDGPQHRPRRRTPPTSTPSLAPTAILQLGPAFALLPIRRGQSGTGVGAGRGVSRRCGGR